MPGTKRRAKNNGLSYKNVVVAVLLGICVSGYLIYRSFSYQAFKEIEWTSGILMFILLALFLMAIRHLAYMYRVWLVTGKQLSFRQSFDTIMIWEFASTATPSTVGGAAVAMFILNKEKVNLGKSTAAVMVITFMDNLFFVVASALFFLLVGGEKMFAISESCGDELDFEMIDAIGGIGYIFLIGFIIELFITGFLGYGIFINPKGFKKILTGVFSIKLLNKWKPKAARTGEEIVTTSAEFQGYSIFFWLKIFLITTLAWSFKYLIVNIVLTAFGDISLTEQIVIMARVLALWVIMFIPFTPGASGVAEVAFLALMCAFVPAGLAATITLLWRMITYYPYLILGAIIFPRWIGRKFRRKTPINSK